jgi:hypothetical protein
MSTQITSLSLDLLEEPRIDSSPDLLTVQTPKTRYHGLIKESMQPSFTWKLTLALVVCFSQCLAQTNDSAIGDLIEATQDGLCIGQANGLSL